MGPRFCKRGNNPNATLAPAVAALQWGHAFVSVETSVAFDVCAASHALQWGHAFVSVETEDTAAFYRALNVLQWGHAFVSVETSSDSALMLYVIRRFNGATLL